MTRHPGKARDHNEPEIVDGLEDAGCTVARLYESKPAGVPDLLVGYQGLNHLLEVKLPLGPKGGDPSRWTDDQIDLRKTWKGKIHEVRSLDEALAAIQSHPGNTATVVQRLTKLRARLQRVRGE